MILLDTCAAIWMATDDATFAKRARAAVLEAASRAELYLSSISAWEIATLARRGRLVHAISSRAFVEQLFSHPGLAEALVDRDIAFTAGALPGEFHGDPADRFIVATAIVHGMRLVTRDRRILDYARRTGALPAMPC